ncbi:unnamed protein product [Peronospora destructor]|uniref:C2 domain-containing protein n=1 Tax=Peronospora destructor TaxID=86335 RepID=A0AAV0UFF2_9STRA|nr:unnamed protein product [Peronospora destructor]
MYRVRAWSWTRMDGRNVLAMPTQTEIRLYDSDDFILLSRLAPSGHRSPVCFVRWSAFHGKLASLSAEQILIHAPQRYPQQRGSVQFAAICCYRLDMVHTNIRGLSFSRSADEMLFCGRDAGLGKLDVRAQGLCNDQALVLWETMEEGCDVAKYSPSAFVFATLRTKEMQVKVWRMRRRLGDADENQTLDRVESLEHTEPVVYFSWKPSTTQWHSALESDGTRKAQWFEPKRILLTCTVTRMVKIWTESVDVCFEPVLMIEPTYLIDNVRWVISKNRNISDEDFQVKNDVQTDHVDWISGVDQKGVLRLWKLVGVMSKSPTVEETSLQIKVNGKDDQQDVKLSVRLGEVYVMAYFPQNYFGMPSKLDIVLQRVDDIMMSFHVRVGEGKRPSQILKKSWYRSHLGSISALSAHPSLPLIASVDSYSFERDSTARNDILVYWISFSAFFVESRLIPSGVLPCKKDSGKVLCIQWVPTLHFDATPLLLVAFESGVIDVYGRSARADVAVVSSPRAQLPRQQGILARSPSLSPWTFYDYVTGESGFEYEVACKKPPKSELDIQFERKKGKLLVSRNHSSNKYLREVIEGDELVGINNKSVVGKEVKEVLKLIGLLSPDDSLLMRFRAACVQNNQGTMGPSAYDTIPQSTTCAPFELTSSSSSDLYASKHMVEDYASDFRRNFCSLVENSRNPHKTDNVVHAGAVSMYGGWRQILHVKAASKLSLLCICPSYADDGEYVPDSVLIFGIESLPGKLCVWKGVRDGAYRSFNLVPLQIQEQVIERKANITSIASERDYRQRAFSGKRTQGHKSLNSLLFIGDAAGNIEHWRCQVVANNIHFTMMSSHPVCGYNSTPSAKGHYLRGSFCRRGYVSADQVENSRQSGDAYAGVGGSICHIEVDDPNRLAVLHADRPDKLHVFEAESGLGILRPEESISSNGRGNILGFSWCNSHVEFNVDALAWDEPGSLLQQAMDWKAAESPQKLPVWHPYVLLTTMFGMHARLLAKVVEDEHSARASATSGVLSYADSVRAQEAAIKQDELGRARMVKSVGRYSTSIHRSDKIDRAENLFASLTSRDIQHRHKFDEAESCSNEDDHGTLGSGEAAVILAAVDSILLGNAHPLQANAFMLFASFSEEHLLEMKALLSFVDAIQSLGFDLDASAADLGAKRFFSMHLFAKSLRSVVLGHTSGSTSNPQNGDCGPVVFQSLLWALHSDAQQFLWEDCIEPRMQWDDIRPLWLGLWVKDVKDLRGIMERVAKVSYTRTKDAMDVCLLYVALGKKNVLSALAKITQLEPNKALAQFLDNDFSVKRWTDAAIKNAYSLLSKKRDLSLAIIISRLTEYQVDDKLQDAFTSSPAGITPAGAITKQLLEHDVIPLFRRKREVWLESCALWWLEDFEQAWAVLLPQFQDVDVCGDNELTPPSKNNLVSSVIQATHFYINLTSLPVYFQHLHSSVNSSLVSWARKKMHQQVYPDTPVSRGPISLGRRRLQLASTADIEHAFSFAAYVCKRSGLSDTALVDMLQARHLINLHARFEILTVEASSDALSGAQEKGLSIQAENSSTSPRFQSSPTSWNQVRMLSCFTSPTANRSLRKTGWSTSRRRMSFMDEVCLPHIDPQVKEKKSCHHRSRASSFSWSRPLQFEKSILTAPWLKAQIADIECRRWSSSAFVGKMIGIRVAREMISHFRAELDLWFQHGDDNSSPTHAWLSITTTPGQRHYHRVKLHREFLDELCTPLCEQFQVDRNYVYEAALAVMHPHAYLHIVEVCFILSELERVPTLHRWVEYVSLSMLHSCSTFASGIIAEDVYRDWESLTIQLCYILNLDAQEQISIPLQVIAYISVAVRTGIIFLGWTRKRMLESPIASGRETPTTQISVGNLGYTFSGAVAARQACGDDISLLSWGGVDTSASQKQYKSRKMYTLILMVSVLRTLYARATVFLSTYQKVDEDDEKGIRLTDIASSLFIPQKLWKSWGEDPLDGLKRWYALIESHLRCEFDYSVKEVPCLCGLYGLDSTAFEEAADRECDQLNCQGDRNDTAPGKFATEETADDNGSSNLEGFLVKIGMSLELHSTLVNASDDYVLLLMQNAGFGVHITLRRFRLDPRVYLKSFVLRDAFSWFARHQFFSCNTEADTNAQIHAFLSRCCKQRKLRLLVTHRDEDTQMFPFDPTSVPIKIAKRSRIICKRCAPVTIAILEWCLCIGPSDPDGLPEDLYLQSMMFVDPWEVEAEHNVRRYMHNGYPPLHVELGCDRLSSICSEACDDIVDSVLEDPDLMTLWKTTGGEGWLVTAITQYHLDGLHSYRTLHQHIERGFAEKEEPRIPFLVEIYSRSQRNAMFEEAGLPHRFVGVITVELIEAKDLIPCSWVGKWSDAYVFLELSHSKDKLCETAEEWSLRTYRSTVGKGGVNPRWNTADNNFVFRFAIPTHRKHTARPMEGDNVNGADLNASRVALQVWNADINDWNRAAVNALEKLLSSVFSGPPTMLRCTVYQKNKLMSHQFMGRAKVPLDELTSGNQMDCWLPLEHTASGSLHIKVSLSFQLMCSYMPGQSQQRRGPLSKEVKY